MHRQARLDVPGAPHRFMVRGIKKSAIFKDDADKAGVTPSRIAKAVARWEEENDGDTGNKATHETKPLISRPALGGVFDRMIIERRAAQGEWIGPFRRESAISLSTARRMNKRSAALKAAGFAISLLAALTLALAGCIGPVALHQAVLGYDKTIHRLESEMLLLNIARMHHHLPDHYTVTSAIAATFDYRTQVGFGAELPGFDTGRDKLFFNAGATAAENPTLSIVPVQGEEFTRRILAPMEEEKFGFLIFQGAPIDLLMRLIADGIEVQKDDGTFDRFILNRPQAPEEYRELRRRALHLHWLNENRKLFVGTINFREGVRTKLAGELTAGDVSWALEKGCRWQPLGGNEYELTRGVIGRVAVTNYDPRTLSNAGRAALNARAAANPKNFVLVDIRPGFPGGDYPLFGGIKLRSLNVVLSFLAEGINETPEFDVSPDPRTGPIKRNPRRTLAVEVTDTIPDTILRAEFGGRHYFVPNTSWDRDAFVILYKLFQMTVTGVSAAGVPITIAK